MSSSFVVLCFSCVALIFEGCQATCQVPTEAVALTRLVNSVTNADKVDLYIDGRLFDQSYYDLASNGPTAPGLGNREFNYQFLFVSDRTPLRTGMHHIQARRSVDNLLLSDTNLLLTDHEQSLLCFGRVGGSIAQRPRMRYLDDAVRTNDLTRSLVRFVHAVSDLPSLDVYFHSSVKLVGGLSHPDLVLHYGEVSDENGGGNGSGRSASDYMNIPLVGTDGLLITASGDTSNVILHLNVSFAIPGFLTTIVIRGQSEAVGTEHAVSTIIIEDGPGNNGTFLADIQTYGIRLANATRLDSVSLLILQSPPDKAQFGPRSTRNTPYPLQERVLNIRQDSVGAFMPLNPDSNISGHPDFWFGRTPFIQNSADTFFHFKNTAKANDRFTFIAIDSIPLGGGTSKYGGLILRDTTSTPPDSRFGRVRFINTSPDFDAHFAFTGKQFVLPKRAVVFADSLVGHYSLTVSDGGTTTGVIPFELIPNRPTTVIIMPATVANPFPYAVIYD